MSLIRLFFLSVAIIYFILISINIRAQDAEKNQQKYFQIRKRFFSEFIIVDSECKQGTNIPLARRTNNTANASLIWSDATIQLSMYIAFLATEYKILKNAGVDYSETLNLLSYALKSFDRLDANAEKFWRGDSADAKKEDNNGFFIRDDVESIYDSAHCFLNADSKIISNEVYTVTEISSDFHSESDNGKPAEMSQDQVWHLFLSLAIVKSLVDDSGFVYEDILGNKVTCRQHAINIIKRIIVYIQGNDIFPWIVLNPVTNQPVRRGAKINEGYQDVIKRDYAFAEAANKIINESENYHKYGSSEHKSFFHNSAAFFINSASLVDKHYSFNALMTIIGDTILYDELYNNDYAGWIIYTQSETGYHEHLPLIYKLLHQNNIELSSNFKQYIQNLLNNAPNNGFYNFYYNEIQTDTIHHEDWNIKEWSSTNRLIWPERLGRNIGHAKGFYNGLDYLLLYNLYQLVYENPATRIKNIIANDQFIVRPNPAIDFVQIKRRKGQNKCFYYEIVDIKGKLIKKGRSEGYLHVSELNNGLYIIKIKFKNNIMIKKLIVSGK